MITRAPQAEDLLPISLATLPVTSTVGVNLYLKTRPSEPPLLFSAAHNPITREHFEQLMRTGSTYLFIHRQDRDLYQHAVRQHWQSLLLDTSLPVLQRLAAVYELARESVGDVLATRDIEALVQTCQYYATTSASILGDAAVTAIQLSAVLHHDDQPATRATNVAAYAMLLGRALGLASGELIHLAIGGLLHDLGMQDIDSNLLSKPGRLLECERRVLKSHPALGLQRVLERNDLAEGAIMMIYQHHERCDGSGYPVGLSASEIHPWSRLCAIADVYDALTSGRPYRPAASRETALAILEGGAHTEFDREMVNCWQRC